MRYSRPTIAQAISSSMLIVLSFSPLLAADPEPRTITAEQFTIGGVTLGPDRVPELLRAFGKPVEVRSEETEAGPDTAKTYVFKGVKAYTQAGELLNLECTSSIYKTFDGAGVGDTVDSIFKIYGKAEVEDRDDGGLVRYAVAGADAALLFHLKENRVSKVELWFDLT